VAATEFAPSESTTDPAPTEFAAAESTTEPLHSVPDYATCGAAPTKPS
jgi:hypothetical protein